MLAGSAHAAEALIVSDMHRLARLDQQFVWHPFTQMRDWLRREPIVIVEGQGAVLKDARGRRYLDANASIWTNLHGHRHPKIDAAIRSQLKKISHSSALGFANEPASLLAAELVSAARSMSDRSASGPLQKVFFSDDGSTAMEVALKLSYEVTRRTQGDAAPRFLGLEGAYHGDTVGAVSVGHIDLFHRAYQGLLFRSGKVMAPYCYRCPFNKAKPERADARVTRKCGWECVGKVEKTLEVAAKQGRPFTSFVVEPLMQGAAGMIPQPEGWLRKVATLCRDRGMSLIADEVMTGFGRTGVADPEAKTKGPAPLFACEREGVQPDYLVVAKGLTGGSLPMAATLTTQAVFDAFLGEYEEFKTFFHGHSFTGNQLGAAAARASLAILQSPAEIRRRMRLQSVMARELQRLWALERVGDVRQVGLVAGIELVKNWRTRQPFELREKAGIRVCETMAKLGVLTRPIGSVVVLIPPYCTTEAQMESIVEALSLGIQAL